MEEAGPCAGRAGRLLKGPGREGLPRDGEELLDGPAGPVPERQVQQRREDFSGRFAG